MMENLNVDSGAVEMMIDNDPNRVIRFYPSDINFAEAFFGLIRDYQTKENELKARMKAIKAQNKPQNEKFIDGIALEKEAFEFVRAGIDKAFGTGTAQIVFGDRNNVDMVARFFRGVSSYVQRARMSEVERYTTGAKENGVMEWA